MDNVSDRVGRPPSALTEARDLIALLGALSDEGDTIAVSTIAARMGIDKDAAHVLLDSLISSGSTTQEYLPLAYSDDSEDEVILLSRRGIRGRPLRLTKQETVALIAAFNYIGMPEDDPLRAKIREDYSSRDVNEHLIARVVAASTDSNDRLSGTLETCAQTIVMHQYLQFDYRTSVENTSFLRTVLPQTISRHHEHWYLEAFDLDRSAQRTFRIDRMSNVLRLERRPSDITPEEESSPTLSRKRDVTLTFSCERYLTLFEWPGLVILSRDAQHITARIPYYYESSTWLPAHIAACRGMVTTEDEQLASEVREYSRQLLKTAIIHHR